MTPWFTSPYCAGRALCGYCRARTPDGEAFRADKMRNFTGLDRRDFECPHGVTWDFVPVRVERKPERIPADFDVERERRRLRGVLFTATAPLTFAAARRRWPGE